MCGSRPQRDGGESLSVLQDFGESSPFIPVGFENLWELLRRHPQLIGGMVVDSSIDLWGVVGEKEGFLTASPKLPLLLIHLSPFPNSRVCRRRELLPPVDPFDPFDRKIHGGRRHLQLG
ncbi:hypothetical protein E2320_006617 [Naja naja]|nr:hypothetical protein E2320_006617 [Naja naja]